MAPPLHVAFCGVTEGPWRVERIAAVIGEGLPPAPSLLVIEGDAPTPERTAWVLRGVTGHERYTTGAERMRLRARETPLGRSEATRAALIPIRKSPEWWALAQDERRTIFEERSRHIGIGLEYLPAVARRLHHGRDLGEPFDFLTWFEYPAAASDAFEELVSRLRATAEWRYVDREVDIRLSRSG